MAQQWLYASGERAHTLYLEDIEHEPIRSLDIHHSIGIITPIHIAFRNPSFKNAPNFLYKPMVTDFLVSLRSEILYILTGIRNTEHLLSWDNTTPNYVTQARLSKIFQSNLILSQSLGIFVVTRHASCANQNHEGYPTSNNYGLEICTESGNFVLSGEQIFQGVRNTPCPCSIDNPSTPHHVIDEIVYSSSEEQMRCHNIVQILLDVAAASKAAGEKMPRSGIREHLLRALLRINDLLLPEPMDTYIIKLVTQVE
jgi:hypothetical protein